MIFFSKTFKHKCPDGSVRIIHKDVDHAFPLFIPGFTTKLNGNLEAFTGNKANLSAEYENKIQGLLYGLDELNHGLMMMFRSTYLVYQSDPCANNDFFQRQIEKIIHEQNRMTALRFQVRGLISLASENSDHNEIMTVYLEIISSLGIKKGDQAATEITENRNAAKKWIGGENEG
jgi:hypothetical protein